MGSQTTVDYGYFVGSEDEDDVEVMAEPRDRYIRGLYYPVQIGEMLDNRYWVQHKLGWGGYSTVWLAYDTQDEKAVALKILSPDNDQTEYHIQNIILRIVQDTSGLLTYQSAFHLPGINNSSHMVLAYPVRGPNLRDTLYKKRSAVPRMIAAKQLLLSLNGLHDAGIVHNGMFI
jgi:serine/threonine protein kinase